MTDLEKDLKEDVKYSVEALESMLAMEKNRDEELKKDSQIMAYRLKVIDKFKDEEL